MIKIRGTEYSFKTRLEANTNRLSHMLVSLTKRGLGRTETVGEDGGLRRPNLKASLQGTSLLVTKWSNLSTSDFVSLSEEHSGKPKTMMLVERSG